jgi:hypothetical protein
LDQLGLFSRMFDDLDTYENSPIELLHELNSHERQAAIACSG